MKNESTCATGGSPGPAGADDRLAVGVGPHDTSKQCQSSPHPPVIHDKGELGLQVADEHFGGQGSRAAAC